jgi:hypothetical protein
MGHFERDKETKGYLSQGLVGIAQYYGSMVITLVRSAFVESTLFGRYKIGKFKLVI